jgi:hypothetical protein
MQSLKIYENFYLSVSYDFQSSMGLKKSRCDVCSGRPKVAFALGAFIIVETTNVVY